MDIFFADPNEVPLPPDEVRILDLQVEPYPDGRRIRVFVELTPFQKKPSGDIAILDSLGNRIAVTSFIEAITPKIEMTLHLRAFDENDQYHLAVTVYYTEELGAESTEDGSISLPEPIIVDRGEHPFSIDNQ